MKKFTITTLAAVGLTLGVAPVANADEASFIVSLGKRGINDFTPGLALEVGNFYCAELRKGREYNHVYSDISDYLAGVPKSRGAVGHLMGAAWNHLCPEFGRLAQSTVLDYIPRSQRR